MELGCKSESKSHFSFSDNYNDEESEEDNYNKEEYEDEENNL